MKKHAGRKALLLAAAISLSLLLTACYVPPDDVDQPVNAGSQNLPFVPVPGATMTPIPTPVPTIDPATMPPAAATTVDWDAWANGGQTPQPGQAAATSTTGAVNTIPASSSVPRTVPPVTIATPTPTPAPLRDGDSGQEVRALQQRLKTLGYYTGSVDGDYGDGTKNAVKAFQRANNLTPDGVVGSQTLQRINSASAVAAQTTSAATAKPTSSGSLKVGSKGSAVYSVQQRLKYLGYYSGVVDGDFGEGTESAVKAFQRRNGLTADGKVGDQTLQKLNSSSAVRAANASANATATPRPAATAGSLKLGSEGSAVRQVQQRLKALGYYTGVADGVFGTETQSAVKAFQRRNGLTADGKVGSQTLQKLNSSSAVRAAGSGTVVTTPTPRPGQTATSLQIGDSGTAVRQVQQRLKELGYYTGVLDGEFGESTRSAVKAFQRRNGLTADGKVGEKTLEKLNSASAVRAASAATATPRPTSSTLQIGDSGSAVRSVQERLKKLGYYTGTVDGEFGADTQRAVRAFQRRNGLSVTGRVNAATLEKLNSASAIAAAATATPRVTATPTRRPTATPRRTATPTPRPTATPRRTATPTPRPTATPKPTKTPRPTATPRTDIYMELGSSRSGVRTLQNRLIELGYLAGKADGQYGGATEAAVRAFQKRHSGLWVDGKAGPLTLEKLYSSSAKKANSVAASIGETLSLGSQGASVKALQTRLRELGYLSAAANGSYGDKTRQAVYDFQSTHGITPNGKANTKTLNAIYASTARPADEVDIMPTATPEPTGGEHTGNITTTGYTTLRQGDQNEAVRQLQQALKDQGYYTGAVNGQFGTATQRAVAAFQEAMFLTADGVAGPTTQRMLYGTGGESISYSTLQMGDAGTSVSNLQYTLYELGYYTDIISGVYGETTFFAVMHFQQRNKLSSVNGIANSATQKKLYSAAAVSAVLPLNDYKNLSYGDVGEEVLAVRDRLMQLGYPINVESNRFDEATRQAVMLFQSLNNLEATGKATKETQAVLYSETPVAYPY